MLLPGGTARTPVGTLVLATVAINILGLALPIATQQIFNRVLRHPENATLTALVLLVILAAAIEGGLRLGRTFLTLQADRRFIVNAMHWLFDRTVQRQSLHMTSGAAASLKYTTSIYKAKERANGQLLVAKAELLFLPLSVAVIFYISWIAGACIAIFMLGSALITYRQATQLFALSHDGIDAVETRFAFLFAVLKAMHPLKAVGAELHMVRRYEHVQATLARTQHQTAHCIARLTDHGILAGKLLTAMLLVVCAYLSVYRGMTLGAVSATILLAGRLLQPLQRAIFILVQTRELRQAEDTLSSLVEDPVPADGPRGQHPLPENLGALAMRGVVLAGYPDQRPIHLDLHPGETIAIHPSSDQGATVLLKTMAGIVAPDGGTIALNGAPLAGFGSTARAHAVAYLSPDARMFDGTIRDNVTRFGEASQAQVLEVARLLEIDRRLNELPNGLETKVSGSDGGGIPPGLQQQIALLRALVLRPRLILFDNADRGLDRDSYAQLVRFLGRIRDQATIVLVSDDGNITALADRSFDLDGTGLSPRQRASAARATYRTLKL